MKVCPSCGRGWVALKEGEPEQCPWCRHGRESLSCLVGGRPRGQEEAQVIELQPSEEPTS